MKLNHKNTAVQLPSLLTCFYFNIVKPWRLKLPNCNCVLFFLLPQKHLESQHKDALGVEMFLKSFH